MAGASLAVAALNIAIVSEWASPLSAPGGVDCGGRQVHVAGLSAALARRGHEVTVYTRRDDSDIPERVTTPEGYSVVHVPAGPARQLPRDELLPHMGPFARYLVEQWRADRPDVAHAHFWMSGVATQLAARHLDLPAVQTFHSLAAFRRRHEAAVDAGPQDRMRLEAMVARSAPWVAATCTDEAAEVMRLGRARNRTSVVPCGVDLELFTPEGSKAERTIRPRIMGVGKLLPCNGFDVLVRALPAIPNAELLLVGGAGVESDREARRLRELAERLGVADRLVLHGAVAHADMPALLRSADVVACMPRNESTGIVALEAMACGVPVVAAAVGGMLDTVIHDVTGRLVTPNRQAEVADAVNHLLHDAFLRQSLGAAGRDRARARYSWDRVAADTQRIYDQLIAERCERSVAAIASSA